MRVDAFRGAQEQVAAAAQRVMKQRDNPVLQLRAEIDHHVAAGDQVLPRKRRVLEKAVLREDAQLAQLALHLIELLLLDEEAFQALGADMLGDAGWVDSAA